MTKNDFMAIVGYHGSLALIDKYLKNKISKKSLQQLLDEGQYKAAFCTTFFGQEQDRKIVLDAYNKISGSQYSLQELERLFGVYSIPEKIKMQQV